MQEKGVFLAMDNTVCIDMYGHLVKSSVLGIRHLMHLCLRIPHHSVRISGDSTDAHQLSFWQNSYAHRQT